MNKLLLYPLVLMTLFYIVIFGFGYGGYASDMPGIAIGGNATYENGTLVFEGSGFYIDATLMGYASIAVGLITIVLAAIGVGTASGVSFLGSGLSTFAQRVLFAATLYLGAWGLLSVPLLSIISQNQLFAILYALMSLSYVVGFGLAVGGE